MNKLQYSLQLAESLKDLSGEDICLRNFQRNLTQIVLGNRPNMTNYYEIIHNSLDLVFHTFRNQHTVSGLIDKLVREPRVEFIPALKVLFASVDANIDAGVKQRLKRIVEDPCLEETELNRVFIQGYIGNNSSHVPLTFNLRLPGCMVMEERLQVILDLLDRKRGNAWFINELFLICKYDRIILLPGCHPIIPQIYERFDALGLRLRNG